MIRPHHPPRPARAAPAPLLPHPSPPPHLLPRPAPASSHKPQRAIGISNNGGSSPKQRVWQKENSAMTQNTPRQAEMCSGELLEEVDLFSQIKFISKECSSIKENHTDMDCISDTLSGNHLEEFSPLFDRDSKANDRDDFDLEIYDVTEADCSFDQSAVEVQPRVGRIKKNHKKTECSEVSASEQCSSQVEVLEIFKSLDCGGVSILHKNNCDSQVLTTELNYLIGSLLNKIKVKGKHYGFSEFEKEFKSLTEDSASEELQEILMNNRAKRQKCQQKNMTAEKEQIKKENCPSSPNFQPARPVEPKPSIVADKLNKISEKVNFYLLKNRLVEAPTAPTHQKQAEQHPQYVETKECTMKSSIASTERGKSSIGESKTSQTSDSFKVMASLRSESEHIRGFEGSSFELNFSQLNKHI